MTIADSCDRDEGEKLGANVIGRKSTLGKESRAAEVLYFSVSCGLDRESDGRHVIDALILPSFHNSLSIHRPKLIENKLKVKNDTAKDMGPLKSFFLPRRTT
jgi:hypothetical protein